jgi:hypothetical protein
MGGRDPNDYLRSAGEAELRAAVDAILGGDIEVDGRDAGEHRPNGHAKAPTHEPYNDDREFSRGVVEPLDPIWFIDGKSDTKAEGSKSKTHTKGKAADPTTINSTTWIWRDSAEIERRKWLLATHITSADQ